MRIGGRPITIPTNTDDLGPMVEALLYDAPLPPLLQYPENAPAKAHGVHQGQFGISDGGIIGTQHVGECVALAACDAQTGTVMVAHVDQFSTPESIHAALGALPRGGRGADVLLLGGRYALSDDAERASRREISHHNIRKVAWALAAHDINIAGAALGDEGQPQALYIDPVARMAYEGVPEHATPDFMNTFAKMILSGGRDAIPLDGVLDLREGPGRRPVLLRTQEAAVLDNHVHGKVDHEVADWFRARPGYRDEGTWIDTCVQMARQWDTAYRASLNDYAQAAGVDAKSLRGAAMFIGEGALDANIQARKADAGIKSGLNKTAPEGP